LIYKYHEHYDPDDRAQPKGTSMRYHERGALALATILFASSGAQAAGFTVPAGAQLSLGSGHLSLAAQDLRIDGALSLGSGLLLDLASLHIGGGAQANLGSGAISLSGDWDNQGSVAAGSSQVMFVDGPSDSAVLGATAFASASFDSANGKRYHFQSGSTQSVSALLQIHGNGVPIQIDVTQAGATAFLDLLPSGTQDIANVGVSDVHASGQPLAPTQTNQGGRGNATGWFGTGGGGGGGGTTAIATPMLSPVGTIVLCLALLGVALRARRRRLLSGASP
jgi:hypothetical protein